MLKAELADAPAWEKTIEKNAKALNISIKTLRRAKAELDVKSKKHSPSGKWTWFLPTHPEVWPPSTEPASDKDSSKDGQRPPSTEPKRDANLKAAPDKDPPKMAIGHLRTKPVKMRLLAKMAKPPRV